jgi:hypothetical protein
MKKMPNGLGYPSTPPPAGKQKSIPKIKNDHIKTPNNERDPPNKTIRQFQAKDSAQKPKRITAKMLFFIQKEKRRVKFVDPPTQANKQKSNQRFQFDMLGRWRRDASSYGRGVFKNDFSPFIHWRREKSRLRLKKPSRNIWGNPSHKLQKKGIIPFWFAMAMDWESAIAESLRMPQPRE